MKKRIEYIDAMRGLTMLLVVYSHIVVFSYGGKYIANPYHFNNMLVLFRMPLFFFISGFILYKVGYLWNISNTCSFLLRKFRVQIIPTVVFGALFASFFLPSLSNALWDPHKGGYWFTVSLFEFFCIYTIQRLIFYYLCIPSWLRDLFLAVVAVALYVLAVPDFETHFKLDTEVAHLIGIKTFRYYIYFLFGIFVKKYFVRFQMLLDDGYVTGAMIVSFFGLTLYVFHNGAFSLVFWDELYKFVVALLGLTVMFAFFRKYQTVFSKDTKLGGVLQYVGTRTLDIYMLHYFFLPRGLRLLGDFFHAYKNPILEFFCSLMLAVLVVAMCLLVSNIIRISPVLGHYLFGVKNK